MGFQGSMIVTREASKDYVVLSTNQSKKLLSGGQMSCNKDAATFWTSSDNIVDDSVEQEPPSQPEMVFGKDMNEWIKEFVQNEFFHERNNNNNNNNNNNTNVEMKKTDTTDEAGTHREGNDTNDLEIEENSIIDGQENENDEREDDIDSSRLSINDESKSGKVKRNFKVFKFMKNALKRHIKK
ncbi:PREDICTED: myb-like protein O [Ceratosolen solmsi marchali]|uniref:Myb-like protein O n=1 Tax=Ceratosolen solmsi marchali TaxID=326594 RepID=A0AAJ6VLZ2_9HYME|nr:PREDICTED: myb-like protein O [Ceratosolen solmsi marchali]